MPEKVTEIHIPKGDVVKITIHSPDSAHAFTLFVTSSNGGWGIVDVWPGPEKCCAVMAWREGRLDLSKELEPGQAVTVDVSMPDAR